MKPYRHDHEYLDDEIERLDLRLGRLAASLEEESFDADALLGLQTAEQRVEKLLGRKRPGSQQSQKRARWNKRLRRLRQRIEERLRLAFEAETYPALVRLALLFSLEDADLRLLTTALAIELSPEYLQLYRHLQRDSEATGPTVALALDLWCDTPDQRNHMRARLRETAPLCCFGLVRLSEAPSFSAAVLRVDTQVLFHALGTPLPDARLAAFCTWREPKTGFDDLLLPDIFHSRWIPFLQKQVAELGRPDSKPVTFFNFHGPAGAGKTTFAEALCKAVGWLMLEVDLELMAREETQIARLAREAVLAPALLCLRGWEILGASLDGRAFLRRLTQVLGDLPVLVVVVSEKPCDLDRSSGNPALELPFEIPQSPERLAHWQRVLAETDLEEAALAALADRFRFTPGQISDAVALAARETEDQITAVSVNRACRKLGEHRLPELARRIEPRAAWEDIVLVPETELLLRELIRQVTHRAKVYHEWGFGAKTRLGKGITALFLGPSGTGKTLAAEVLASVLGLDLFTVDLSALISKYIGETEKNLEIVFREAEAANAVLFFDEADAVFGKRTTTESAHDRYANIEVSYLLQRIEAYEGIAILASNFYNNLDEAFVRRMRSCIEFAEPDAEQRRLIWQKHLPEEVPLTEDLDFEFLADQFQMTGGHIRNALLTASFLAVDDDHLTMDHLITAVIREHQKTGRTLTAAELGPYADGTREVVAV